MNNYTNTTSVNGYLNRSINKGKGKTIYEVFLQEINKTKYCPVGQCMRIDQIFYFDFEATIDDLTYILPSLLIVYHKQHNTEEETFKLMKQITDIVEKATNLTKTVPYDHTTELIKKIQLLFNPLIDIAKNSII